MSTASTIEREMLALINEERTSRELNPLQLETNLNASSEDHSTWMLDRDIFSHTGAGGSSATQRMQAAGFDLSGSWRTGENIAWQSERGAPGISDDVAQLHQNLMNSPGHRANILNPNFEYIGIGIETGDMQGFDAVMVTQNFGATAGTVDLDTGTTPTPTPMPEEPEVPEEPEIPEEPETPEEPQTPEVPEEPETPTEPETPEEPETPVEPETPEEPEEPVEPETPEEPEAPEEPETPEPTAENGFDIEAFVAALEEFLNEVLALVDDFDWIDIELPGAQPGGDLPMDDDLILIPEAGDGATPPAEEPIAGFTDDDDMLIFTPMGGECMMDVA